MTVCGRRVFLLFCVAGCVLSAVRCGGAVDSWWNESWECRVRVDVPAAPVAMRLPVVISGAALRRTGVEERVPTASFRVVGPDGEVPSQVDERDGTAEWVSRPNRRLDEDDELVFVAGSGPSGPSAHFVYFSRHPRPPGRYRTALRYGRPSAAFNKAPIHGVFYDDEFKVGVKGPKTADPTARDVLNYCSGAISSVRWRGYDFVYPVRAWQWFIPRHPFGGGASEAVWSLPELVIDGPVRKVVLMRGMNVGVTVASVRHWVAVYAGCGVVDFTEAVEHTAVPQSPMYKFQFPLAVCDDLVTAYGTGTGMCERRLSADECQAQRSGKVVVVHDSSKAPGSLPWWAWSSPGRRVGLALLLVRGAGGSLELPETGKWSAVTYVRNTQSCTNLVLKPIASPTIRHTMRFCCIDGLEGVPVRFASWAEPERWLTVGPLEIRGDVTGEGEGAR